MPYALLQISVCKKQPRLVVSVIKKKKEKKKKKELSN
jgi:hypothetical protein